MRAELHRRWYTLSKSRRPLVDEIPDITFETRMNGALRVNHRILCPLPEVLSARVFPEGCGGDWTMWRRDPARCRLRTRYPRLWLCSCCRRLLRTRSRTPGGGEVWRGIARHPDRPPAISERPNLHSEICREREPKENKNLVATAGSHDPKSFCLKNWRRERDSNPRYP
jgi:hypothetical protein